MLSNDEKNEIRELQEKGKPLPKELKTKLLNSIKKGESSIFETPGDHLCCDLGIDAPDRYQWLTFEDCKALGGTAADNSKCGH